MNADGWRLAIARSILHDIPIHMALGDSFHHDEFPDLRADVIMCEPPYGGRTAPARDLPGDPRWQLLGLFEAPPARADEFAWLAHVISHLAPGGRGYVLMPPGALFRGGTRDDSGSELVRRGTVEAITLNDPHLPARSPSVARCSRGCAAAHSQIPLDVLFIAADQVTRAPGFRTCPTRPRGHGAMVAPLQEFTGRIRSDVSPVLELLAGDVSLLPSGWVHAPSAKDTRQACAGC